jgi:mannose-6-phosphate isomerase-like protein (cupin superfamily)
MEFFELSDLEAERELKGKKYLQFLSERRLSVGLYKLKVGERDPQEPHKEDEVYYVLRGQASVQIGTEKQEVKRGSIIYVGAEVNHKFNEIKEDLELLVFFAPAHAPST